MIPERGRALAGQEDRGQRTQQGQVHNDLGVTGRRRAMGVSRSRIGSGCSFGRPPAPAAKGSHLRTTLETGDAACREELGRL